MTTPAIRIVLVAGIFVPAAHASTASASRRAGAERPGNLGRATRKRIGYPGNAPPQM